MTKIIKNKIINIFGLPGSGKTFIASYFAFWYYLQKKPIISNIDFFYKNGTVRVNKKIGSINDLKYIDYQQNGGLIIIDEGGLNINSRQSQSATNLMFAEMLFLSRKKNCDLIFIAQLDFSIDKYVRFMANGCLCMDSYFDGPNHLIFTIEIKKHDYTIGFKEIDLITFSEESNFFYSTLESSKIDKRSEKQINKELADILKKEIKQKKEFDKNKKIGI